MDNISSGTGGTKRPAEPGAGPGVQPQPKTSTGLKRITLRMSSIPIGITKEYLSRILEGLATPRNGTTEAKHRRGTNVHSLSLAPSASEFDSDKYQVATVTFKEIPPALTGCVSNTETIIALLEAEGGEIEVDVDSHFRGLTPLNHASNPSVEYVVPSISLLSIYLAAYY